MSASDSLGSDSGAIRKSVLLGSRKARPAAPDKPVVVTRRDPSPPNETPQPQPEPPPQAKTPPKAKAPARPRAPRKAPAPKKADPLVELRAELEQLKSMLEQRPTWADLQRLEVRLDSLRPQPPQAELEALREQLQNRDEELAEMSSLMEETELRHQQLAREAQELMVEREHLENLLAETRQDLQEMEERCSELQLKLRRSEGFLRDALLGLLSPGDEYNEDLVEQIQHFLSL